MWYNYITPVYSSYNSLKNHQLLWYNSSNLKIPGTSRHLEPPTETLAATPARRCEAAAPRRMWSKLTWDPWDFDGFWAKLEEKVWKLSQPKIGMWHPYFLGKKSWRTPMQASENLDVAPLPPNGHHHCQDFSIHVRGHSDPWDTSLPTLLRNRWITKNRDSASKHEEIHSGFTQRTWTILARNATAMIAVHHRVSPLRSIFKMASAWPLAARWNQRPKKLQDGDAQDLNGPAVLVGNPPAVGKSPWLDAVKKNGLSRDRAPHSMLSNV